LPAEFLADELPVVPLRAGESIAWRLL